MRRRVDLALPQGLTVHVHPRGPGLLIFVDPHRRHAAVKHRQTAGQVARALAHDARLADQTPITIAGQRQHRAVYPLPDADEAAVGLRVGAAYGAQTLHGLGAQVQQAVGIDDALLAHAAAAQGAADTGAAALAGCTSVLAARRGAALVAGARLAVIAGQKRLGGADPGAGAAGPSPGIGARHKPLLDGGGAGAAHHEDLAGPIHGDSPATVDLAEIDGPVPGGVAEGVRGDGEQVAVAGAIPGRASHEQPIAMVGHKGSQPGSAACLALPEQISRARQPHQPPHLRGALTDGARRRDAAIFGARRRQEALMGRAAEPLLPDQGALRGEAHHPALGEPGKDGRSAAGGHHAAIGGHTDADELVRRAATQGQIPRHGAAVRYPQHPAISRLAVTAPTGQHHTAARVPAEAADHLVGRRAKALVPLDLARIVQGHDAGVQVLVADRAADGSSPAAHRRHADHIHQRVGFGCSQLRSPLDLSRHIHAPHQPTAGRDSAGQPLGLGASEQRAALDEHGTGQQEGPIDGHLLAKEPFKLTGLALSGLASRAHVAGVATVARRVVGGLDVAALGAVHARADADGRHTGVHLGSARHRRARLAHAGGAAVVRRAAVAVGVAQLAVHGRQVEGALACLGVAGVDGAAVAVITDHRCVAASLARLAGVQGAWVAVAAVGGLAAGTFAGLAGRRGGAGHPVIAALSLGPTLQLTLTQVFDAGVAQTFIVHVLGTGDLRGGVGLAGGLLAALVAVPDAIAQITIVVGHAVRAALAGAGPGPRPAGGTLADVALGAGVTVFAGDTGLGGRAGRLDHKPAGGLGIPRHVADQQGLACGGRGARARLGLAGVLQTGRVVHAGAAHLGGCVVDAFLGGLVAEEDAVAEVAVVLVQAVCGRGAGAGVLLARSTDSLLAQIAGGA